MAKFDRQFEVVRPSLDMLERAPLEVADTGLINPTGTSPVPLVDGELVQLNSSYKWARASDATKPSHFVIEDRGDYGVQASRKLSAIMVGGFEADTIVFNETGMTLGGAIKAGFTIDLGDGLNRAGIVNQGGSGLILGYVTRLSAGNGGRVRFLQTLV